VTRRRRDALAVAPAQEIDRVLSVLEIELRRVVSDEAHSVVIETLRTVRGRSSAIAANRSQRFAALAPPPSRRPPATWISSTRKWAEATALVAADADTPQGPDAEIVDAARDQEDHVGDDDQ